METVLTFKDFNDSAIGYRAELIKSHIRRGHCKAIRPSLWADKVLHRDFSAEVYYDAVMSIIAQLEYPDGSITIDVGDGSDLLA